MKPNSGFAVALVAALAFAACNSSNISAGQNASAGGNGGSVASAAATGGGGAPGGVGSVGGTAAGAAASASGTGASGGAANTCESNGCTFALQPYMFQYRAASTTLACFCSTFSQNGTNACPQTEAEARALLAQNPFACPEAGPAADIVRTGCGYVTVGHESLGSKHWYYDASTGALVGADVSDDTPFGPCNNAATYAGGFVPPSCPTATTCTLCTAGGLNMPVCP